MHMTQSPLQQTDGEAPVLSDSFPQVAGDSVEVNSAILDSVSVAAADMFAGPQVIALADALDLAKWILGILALWSFIMGPIREAVIQHGETKRAREKQGHEARLEYLKLIVSGEGEPSRHALEFLEAVARDDKTEEWAREQIKLRGDQVKEAVEAAGGGAAEVLGAVIHDRLGEVRTINPVLADSIAARLRNALPSRFVVSPSNSSVYVGDREDVARGARITWARDQIGWSYIVYFSDGRTAPPVVVLDELVQSVVSWAGPSERS